MPICSRNRWKVIKSIFKDIIHGVIMICWLMMGDYILLHRLRLTSENSVFLFLVWSIMSNRLLEPKSDDIISAFFMIDCKDVSCILMVKNYLKHLKKPGHLLLLI